jgi:transposase
MAKRAGRDFSWLEQRRQQAALLFRKGQTVLASVARQLKVSRQSVSRWYQQWEKGGARALQGAGRAGRKSRLSPRQLKQLETALLRGPAAHGWSAELWTLSRVSIMMERITGEKYHPGHVWKILGSMNWSAQKPERQAKERSQEKVDYWKNVRWPEVKKRCSPTSLDLLSRRIRIQPTTVRSNNLGTARQNTDPEATGQSLE